jgi:mannose-6-phosphate isomerase
MPLPVLCFTPVYRDYVWGGNLINRLFLRGLPDGVYAESWEIADRDDGMSVVSGGPMAGRTLESLLAEFGTALTGTAWRGGRFPLLVKLIDARETLSVQVHPDEEDARRHGGEPKSEMWYVLHAEAGACVYRGLKPSVDAAQFARALSGKDVLALLNQVPVKAGDTVYVPGGCVHAIGGGCLLLEIQQNSNTTYRLHDGGRVDARGRPRELHVEQGLRAMRATTPANDHRQSTHFRFETSRLDATRTLKSDGSSFQILFVARGSVRVGEVRVSSGQTVLIPASADSCTLAPAAGAHADIVRVTLP